MTAPSPVVAGSQPRAGRPGGRRTSLRSLRAKDAAIGIAFVSPILVGITVLGLVPFVLAVWYGFHNWHPLLGEFEWAGWGNYERLLHDKRAWGALLTTLQFSLLLVVLNITLALTLAVLLNAKFRARAFFRTVFFLPVVVSSVAWVLIWQYLVAANGGINGALATIGITGPNWLREESTALITVVVIQVFKGVGMNMVLFLAALQNVPGDLYEAARLDGASRWGTMWRITIPLITPTVLMVVIITVASSLDIFVPIQVLTSGGPGDSTTVISYLIYRTAFSDQQFGYASVLGVLMFLVTLAITAIQWGSRKRWVHDEV